MKQINFSRSFPAYHPRKGEPTFFVEQILNQRGIDYTDQKYIGLLWNLNPNVSRYFIYSFWESLKENSDCKSHTIRAHKRPIQVGESFTPTCWAGKPYKKTEDGYWKIQFAPPIEVKKKWDFKHFDYDEMLFYRVNDCPKYHKDLNIIAKNDGLTFDELTQWFKLKKNEELNAEIICWNEKVEY